MTTTRFDHFLVGGWGWLCGDGVGLLDDIKANSAQPETGAELGKKLPDEKELFII